MWDIKLAFGTVRSSQFSSAKRQQVCVQYGTHSTIHPQRVAIYVCLHKVDLAAKTMSQPSVCFSNVGEKRFIELGASFYDATRHHRWKSPVERIDDDDANKGSGQHARANVQPTAAPIVVGVHYIVSQPIGAKEVLADIKICSTRLCFVQVVTNEWATTARARGPR